MAVQCPLHLQYLRSVALSIYLFIYLSIYLSIYLFVYLSIYLPILNFLKFLYINTLFFPVLIFLECNSIVLQCSLLWSSFYISYYMKGILKLTNQDASLCWFDENLKHVMNTEVQDSSIFC